MPRRKTPEDEERRLSERIMNNYRREIKDKGSFDLAFSKELQLSDKELTDNQRKLRDNVFKRYSSTREVQKEIKAGDFTKADLFKKAGGKDLEADRRRTAKVVVKDKKEYVKRGARRVDLKDYDTAKSRLVPARRKGKVVYAYKTHVKIKNKVYVRHRDRNGRFVSVRKR